MTRTIAWLILISPAIVWSQCQVVNAASYQPSLPSGGSLATAFCQGLQGRPGLYVAPPSSPLPFTLGGVEVLINGELAPILAVYLPTPASAAGAQVNFQVPLSRDATSFLTVGTGIMTVFSGVPFQYLGINLTALPVASVGGFFADANGFALAQHATDNSPVTVENPAHPG